MKKFLSFAIVLFVTASLAHAQTTRPARRPNGPPKPPPDFEDVSYGPDKANLFDLWQAAGDDKPHPLAINIHGGGWMAGSKKALAPAELRRLLDGGVTVASIEYRFSTVAPYPAPMIDCARALQFLRYHAKDYNIDPKRVALFGTSAGAVNSMWIGFQKDLADPKATDPVLRESTRVTCLGLFKTPTTLDKQTMDDWFGFKVKTHPALTALFNVQDPEDLYKPEIRAEALAASPYTLLSAGAPPFFIGCDYDTPLTPNDTVGKTIHHGLFCHKLKEKADSLGVEAYLQTPTVPDKTYGNRVEFMLAKLKAAN